MENIRDFKNIKLINHRKNKKEKSENSNMKKYLMKDRFLHFITALIVCILLGYLYHDLVNGIRNGIFIGIGIIIGETLIQKRKERIQEKQKKK